MRWRPALVFTLTATASVIGYFALQVCAALVAFFAYGSGETFSAKSGNISVMFVVAQLALVSCLFYRRVWLKKMPAFLLALLIPVGLFLALEGFRSLPD